MSKQHEPKHSAATEMFDDVRWLPPVASPALLPTDDVREGHTCFVVDECAIYEFRDGKWVLQMAKQ